MTEFTNTGARNVEYFLRRKYKKDKRTSLKKLCLIAVLREVREQANADVVDVRQVS